MATPRTQAREGPASVYSTVLRLAPKRRVLNSPAAGAQTQSTEQSCGWRPNAECSTVLRLAPKRRAGGKERAPGYLAGQRVWESHAKPEWVLSPKLFDGLWVGGDPEDAGPLRACLSVFDDSRSFAQFERV